MFLQLCSLYFCLCVGQETAETIEMPYKGLTDVDPTNQIGY